MARGQGLQLSLPHHPRGPSKLTFHHVLLMHTAKPSRKYTCLAQSHVSWLKLLVASNRNHLELIQKVTEFQFCQMKGVREMEGVMDAQHCEGTDCH